MGPFTPPAAKIGNQYILVATDYCTKSVEAKPLWDNMTHSTQKFLYENIWCRFDCPIEIVSDQDKHFVNEVITSLTHHYAVVHRCSTPYYPQANGLAESTNQTLKGILTKIVNAHRTDWDKKLQSALWAYHTALKPVLAPPHFVWCLDSKPSCPLTWSPRSGAGIPTHSS